MRNYKMWKSNVGYTEFRVQSNGDYEITGYAWIAVRDSYRLCYKRIVDYEAVLPARRGNREKIEKRRKNRGYF